MKNLRDNSLDYLKGFGCLCMALGHLRPFDKADIITNTIECVFSFGMVFFFSVSGVTAVMQQKRYTLFSMLKFYLFLALLGLCWNIMVYKGLSALMTVEMLQIIAAGAALVFVVEHFFSPSDFAYLAIAVGIMVIKVIFDNFFPAFDGLGLLLARNEYVPLILNPLEEDLVLTGFPIIPWASVFFAGVFCYRVSNRYNLWAGCITILILAVLKLTGFQTNYLEKWDMSIGYFLCSMLLIFFGFYIARRQPAGAPSKYNLLIFWGRNSLLVVFVHGLGVMIAWNVARDINHYLGWALAFIITTTLMILFARIKSGRIFQNAIPWIIMIIVLIILPFVAQNNEGVERVEYLIKLIALIFGVTFAVNARALSRLIKQ